MLLPKFTPSLSFVFSELPLIDKNCFDGVSEIVKDVSSLKFSECCNVRDGIYKIELEESIWYSNLRLKR